MNATYNGHSKERTGGSKTTYDTMEQMIAESQIKFSLDKIKMKNMQLKVSRQIFQACLMFKICMYN